MTGWDFPNIRGPDLHISAFNVQVSGCKSTDRWAGLAQRQRRHDGLDLVKGCGGVAHGKLDLGGQEDATRRKLEKLSLQFMDRDQFLKVYHGHNITALKPQPRGRQIVRFARFTVGEAGGAVAARILRRGGR